METEEAPDLPEFRFTDDPSRFVGAGVEVVVVLAIMTGVRYVVVGVLNDPVHPVTYAALVGGCWAQSRWRT